VIGVVALFAIGAIVGPAFTANALVVAAEGATEGSTTLYRGVAEGHHAFEDALEGVARPGDVLGHADPVRHNEGFTYNSRLI
jgi:hypothetical protein